MSLVRWSPRRSFGLQHEIDNLVNTLWNGFDYGGTQAWNPRMDIVESDDAYTVHADLPGIDKSNLSISFRDGVLQIDGERTRPEPGDKHHRFDRWERVYGKFSRSIRFPTGLDADKATADYSNGVFTLTIPKVEAVKPKQIEVKVS